MNTKKVQILNLFKNRYFHYSVFLIVVFTTQFSSISIEVVDWDESTFFIISKYVSEGKILYLDYWDSKPPLMFFYLASMFKIFGPSLLIGRLAGDLLIFLIIIHVYKILNNFYNLNICFFSSLFLIYLFSYEASQPTMTEHLGILFIVVSIDFVFKKNNIVNLIIIGILFSLSFNTRNNLAFACIAISIYLLFIKKIKVRSFKWVFVGFIIPICFISVYFFIKSSFKYYFYMLFQLPFQTTQTYRMNFNEFIDQILSILNLDQYISIELIIIVTLLITIIITNSKFSNLTSFNIDLLNYLIIFFLTISIIFGGRLFNHYLIQLFPSLAIIFASTLNYFSKNKLIMLFVTFFVVLLNINLFTVGLNNLSNYQNIRNNYKIALMSDNLRADNNTSFLALENHLIFFYNDFIKQFKVVHPSSLTNPVRNKDIFDSLKKFGLVENDQFLEFVENKPDYIFCENNCELYIDQSYYVQNYFLLEEVDGLKLFQKNRAQVNN